ncbi:MAG: SRPBCC family protein [Gammaproteobacteria bacterium]
MSNDLHELRIERILDASRQAVWRCWTEPDLLMQWFCPVPWRVTEARLDLRPGGEFLARMAGPDGETEAVPGVFLEVVPQVRLVHTDAFLPGWVPNPDPFMLAIIEFADRGTQTHYVARARHWHAEKMQQHAAMGFHAGWNAAADQLEALARTL